MTRVAAALAAAGLLAATLAGCSVRIGDDDGPAGPTQDGTVQAVEEGDPMQWDLTRPITAESVGAPDGQLVVVQVPEGGADVELTLPSGTWSAHAEELTVETAHGHVVSVDVFVTAEDGDDAYARMSADAGLLGLSTEHLDDWHAGLPAVHEGSTDGRVKKTFNGSDGLVATSVQAGLESGEGAGAPVRLWYKLYVRDLLESEGLW